MRAVGRAGMAAACLSAALCAAEGPATQGRVVLRQNSAAKAYARFDQGELPRETRLQPMRILLAQTMDKRDRLTALLAAQQNPDSVEYHHWLSPEEYGKRFGAAPADRQRVVDWLEANGMRNITLSPGMTSISFTAGVVEVDQAFNLKLHRYMLGSEQHYANAGPPVLPQSVGGLVAGIQGLDDFRPHPTRARLASRAAYVTASNTGQSLGPGDLATIYDAKPFYSAGFNGQGMTIAVVGAGTPSLTDFQAYKQTFGLPANDFEAISVPGSQAAANTATTQIETALDLEIAGGIAPQAKLIYVQDADVLNAVTYVVDHQLAQIVSMSYTSCELPGPEDMAYETLAQQAIAEGITWVNAAGDAGAAACDPAGASAAVFGLAVNLPASAPDVTGVGGTEFTSGSSSNYWAQSAGTTTALSYVPETAWNGASAGETVTAGGGGVSQDFFRPAYQSDIADGQLAREVPDIALDAAETTPPYLIIVGGKVQYVGGTSGATPLFAGLLALVDEYLVAKGEPTAPGLGNINPVLYRLAETAPATFHDITNGTNQVACAAGSLNCSSGSLGYTAATGYDMVTGLGSVDAWKLAQGWETAILAPSMVTLNAGTPDAAGNLAVAAQVMSNSSGAEIAPGVVFFSWTDAAYANVPFLAARVPVDAQGTAATTLTGLPAGPVTLSANYQGTTSMLGSVSTPVTVNVTRATTKVAGVQIVDAEAQVPVGKYLSLSATVNGANTLPTGSVAFYYGTEAAGTATLVNGTATVFSATLPPAGDVVLTAQYSGDSKYAPAVSSPFAMTVVSPPTPAQAPVSTPAAPATVTLTAVPMSAKVGTAVTLTAVVQPSSGSAQATGSVTFLSGGVALGAAVPLARGQASAAYTTLPAGTANLTASYGGSATDAAAVSSPVAIVISPAPAAAQPDFTLAAPATLSLTSGTAGSFPFTVTPSNGFSGTVTLACSGVVTGYACSVPKSVTPVGTTSVTATLAVQATAWLSMLAAWLLHGCLRGFRKSPLTPAFASLGLMLFLGGCGVNNSKTGVAAAAASTPASESYTLTLTATSGQLVHTAVVAVTVE